MITINIEGLLELLHSNEHIVHTDYIIEIEKPYRVNISKITSKNRFVNCEFKGFRLDFYDVRLPEKREFEHRFEFDNCDFTNEIYFIDCNLQSLSFSNFYKSVKKLHLAKVKLMSFAFDFDFDDNKITGIGPRMFRYNCMKEKYYLWEGCSTHPHNTYVQLLAEMGIIGFIFGVSIFLITFIAVLKHLYCKFIRKKIIYNDFQLCLLSAIMISIWPFVPTGDLFNNWLNIIYFFPVGFYLGTLYEKET